MARTALAVVVLLAGVLVLPRPASRVLAPDATAQVPTPTIPDILGSPKPSPSPTKTSDPGGGGGGGPGGGGGQGEQGGGKGKGKKARGDDGKTKKGKKGVSKLERKRRRKNKPEVPPGVYRPGTHSFTTDRLVSVAAQLRSLGWSSDDVIRRVYPPFIIAGEAAWINTWGAPRYGPGPIVRTHEGQDVFCDFGAPVLASEPGIIEFDEGGLGGRVARLFRADGSYWYYAHLSDWNLADFSTGAAVVSGDVIGYCGNSGNAITTPPHVHFGLYLPNGRARDPHRTLIDWLRTAEDRILGLVAEALGTRVKHRDRLTAARRFGDAFVPDRSELGIAGESLWASGSYPATGALGLAQAALQAALSLRPVDLESGDSVVFVPAEQRRPATAPSPSETLAEILEGRERSEAEAPD